MRNMLDRCVVGSSSAFPDVQKSVTVHATPILGDEGPGNKELSTEVG